jgi:hypothetical protein
MAPAQQNKDGEDSMQRVEDVQESFAKGLRRELGPAFLKDAASSLVNCYSTHSGLVCRA